MRTSLLALALVLPGCRGGYFCNRLRDAGDIIDLKVGGGLGIGAKVEASTYVGAGLGLGIVVYGEKYGRVWESVGPAEIFLRLILSGIEVRKTETGDGPYVLGINTHPFYSTRPRLIERWRFGGELLLFVTGGLYLNFGELADFLAGWFGADLAGDDERPRPASIPAPSGEKLRAEGPSAFLPVRPSPRSGHRRRLQRALLVIPLLLWVARSRPPRGVLFAHFLFCYAFLRIFVDLFREYPTESLGLPTGQLLNVIMSMAGLSMLLRFRVA